MAKLRRRDFLTAAAASIVAPPMMSGLLEKHEGEGVSIESFAGLAGFDDRSISNQLSLFVEGFARPAPFFELDETEHPGGAIRPGQPISFRWGVHDWSSPSAAQSPLAEDPRFRLSRARLTWNGNQIWESPDRTGSIIVPTVLANRFYAVRPVRQVNVLQLHVSIPGTTTEFAPAIRNLRVVPDDLPTWQWIAPAPACAWGQPYSVIGQVTNHSRYTSMTIAAVLREGTVGVETPLIPFNTYTPASVTVGHSAGATITLAPAILWSWTPNTWQWFDRFLLLPYGNTDRTFGYSLSLTATDPTTHTHSDL